MPSPAFLIILNLRNAPDPSLTIQLKMNEGAVAGSHRLSAGRDQRGASWLQAFCKELAETSAWMHVVVGVCYDEVGSVRKPLNP